MNRPGVVVRVAGSPLPALLLFLGCAAIVLGWSQDAVPWWGALGAVGAALQTLRAIGHMRRYKAWAAEWDAMGAPLHAPPQAPRRSKRGWVWVTGAVLLFLSIPGHLPQIRSANEGAAMALTGLWVAVCLYLLWKLSAPVRRFFARKAVRSQAKVQAKVEAAPVAWMLGRASSSPSRAEAERNLPDYSAACLRQNVERSVRRMTA